MGIARFAPGWADLRGIFVQQTARLGLDLSGVELRGHPLPLYRRAERLHTARCLLVGDAAGLVDPLLGEDIRYAIYSAQMAAQVIVQDDLTGYTRRVQPARAAQLSQVRARVAALRFQVAVARPVRRPQAISAGPVS